MRGPAVAGVIVPNAMSRLSSRASVHAPDCLASLGFAEAIRLRPVEQSCFCDILPQSAVPALACGREELFVAFSLRRAIDEIIHDALGKI